jgi:hypothetical protein
MYRTNQNSPSFDRALHADLVVAGGGVAGTCAAVAAARAGLKVVLIQNRPVLGGPSSSECQFESGNCVNGASEYVNRNARETGVIEDLKNEHAYRYANGWRNHWSQTLRDAAEREGVTLLLNTELLRGSRSGDRIEYVDARGIGSELNYRIYGRCFVDATGDGTLGHSVGAEFRMGREGKAEFGESMAPEAADAKTMGNSIAFRAVDTGRPVPFKAPEWAYKINSDSDLPYRLHNNPVAGYWWLEYGGELDTIADTEDIYRTLLSVLYGMWDHVKNGADHGAANYAITWVAPIAGKRESRRFIGDYMLSERDLREEIEFPDAVAYGGWPIDLHPPEGVFGKGHPGGTPPFFFPGTYPIPFRSLYSRNIGNLLLAGRDISVSHVALGTTRLMATCGVCGHAVGIAAQLLCKYDCTPRELTERHLAELRERLQQDDLTLPQRPIALPGDLSATARITASSAQKLEMQPMTGTRPLVAPPKGTEIYDPCDIPPEDRRLGQTIPVTTDFIGEIRVKFNNPTAAAQAVTARLRSDFFGADLASATASVEPGNEAIGVFRFDLKVTPGSYKIVLDAVPELEVCTSSRYLPGVERKLDGCYIDFENFIFDVLPEQSPYGAEQLRNDYGRPSAERSNLWISDPAAGLPQTVELSWDAPVEFSRIDLVFDTNLDRKLVHEIPPECVRHYRLEAVCGGQTTLLAEETENYKRFAVHKINGKAEKLRLTVLAAYGDPSARLAAFRVFR